MATEQQIDRAAEALRIHLNPQGMKTTWAELKERGDQNVERYQEAVRVVLAAAQ